MTTDGGRGDGDPIRGPVPTRVPVARRSWLVPGLVVVLALAVALVGFFGNKTVPPAPPPSTTPSPASISFDWTEIPLDPATFAGAVVGLVVSGPRGVLALGQQRTDRHPIAWTSEDGRNWMRTDLPPSTFGGGVPDSAVQLSTGWVALGYHATADGTSRDIWTSPDGVAWARDPSATGRGFDQVVALTGSGRTAVVVANAGSRQVLLSSLDGRVWAETPDLDATLGRNPEIHDVAAYAGGYVAVGNVGSEPAIWRSADGHDWARSSPPHPSLPLDSGLRRVFRTAEGLLISSSEGFRGGSSSSWVSDDGVAWTPSPMSDQALGEFRTVLALDGGNLGVTGDNSDAEQGYAVAWAGATPSTGVTAPTPEPFDWVRQAAVVNGQMLLIADKVRDGSIGAWLGTLDVADAAVASPRPSHAAASKTVEPSPSALPPSGRARGSDANLDWTILRSPTALNEEGRELAIAGVERLGSGLLAYGSDGYDSRFWLATDKSHWRLLPPSPTMRHTQVTGVATLGGLIVAVGQVLAPDGAVGTRAVWTSADAESWKRVKNFGDAAPGQLIDVVAGPEGLVAVGSRGDGGQYQAAIWTSPDGSTWTTVTSFAESAPPTQFNAVAHGTAGYVAVGTSEGTDFGGSQGVAWTSPDGRTWTKAEAGIAFAPAGDPTLGEGSVNISDVVAGDAVAGGPAFIAVGTDQRRFASVGAIFSSPDGRTWSRAPSDPALDGVYFVGIVGWAGGLAAAGNVYASGGTHPVVWISDDGVSWAPLDDADLTHGRSGELRDAFVTDLVADGSGLIAVGSSFAAGEPPGAVVWAGAGPGAIVADHVCPAVIDSPTRLASMTGADRAACVGARPVTVKALVRAELNDCSDPGGPPELSECGGMLWLAPIAGGPEVVRIRVDRSLVDAFSTTGSTPWALTLRSDVVGPACDPVPARNGVIYQPPEAVHLQCRALLRLIAHEPVKAR